jgi:hypothetical protein
MIPYRIGFYQTLASYLTTKGYSANAAAVAAGSIPWETILQAILTAIGPTLIAVLEQLFAGLAATNPPDLTSGHTCCCIDNEAFKGLIDIEEAAAA